MLCAAAHSAAAFVAAAVWERRRQPAAGSRQQQRQTTELAALREVGSNDIPHAWWDNMTAVHLMHVCIILTYLGY